MMRATKHSPRSGEELGFKLQPPNRLQTRNLEPCLIRIISEACAEPSQVFAMTGNLRPFHRRSQIAWRAVRWWANGLTLSGPLLLLHYHLIKLSCYGSAR